MTKQDKEKNSDWQTSRKKSKRQIVEEVGGTEVRQTFFQELARMEKTRK